MMGAGPTHRMVTDARRRTLTEIARRYGGEYVPATYGRENYARNGAAWRARTRLIRASNGEAALLFKASTGSGRESEWRLSYREAMKEAGIEEVAT